MHLALLIIVKFARRVKAVAFTSACPWERAMLRTAPLPDGWIAVAGQKRRKRGHRHIACCGNRLDDTFALQRRRHAGKGGILMQRFLPGVEFRYRIGAMHGDILGVM
jgi:hypothetical protein